MSKTPSSSGPAGETNEPSTMGPRESLRAVFGGLLMGLANLVPGISGGTMLLAVGIYPRFVEAVAAVTSLRLRKGPLLLLGLIAGAALTGIVLLAGPVKDLVVEHRWVMYSLFIGLTLGGVPVVWALARPVRPAVLAGALAGIAVMVVLALGPRAEAGSQDSNLLLLFVAGLAGAGAMILPGVSGGYLLLLLGQYVPILAAIEDFEAALRAGERAVALHTFLHVLLPVGLGVLLGVVAVSRLLRWLLHRYEKATLGVLLGLLLGAVVGLWPFQRPVEPIPGQTIVKGRVLVAEDLATVEIEDLPTETFPPTASQVVFALLWIAGGFSLTTAVARLGRREEEASPRGD